MVQNCCVKSCRNTAFYKSNVSFHQFPKDANRRRKWMIAVNLNETDLSKNKNMRVCSEHFLENQYIFGGNIKRLRKDAVPTLGHQIIDEDHGSNAETCKSLATCATSKCINNRNQTNELQLDMLCHNFPNNEEIHQTAAPTLCFDSYTLNLNDKNNLINKNRNTKTEVKEEEMDEFYDHNQVFLEEIMPTKVQIKQEATEDEEILFEVSTTQIENQESDPLTNKGHISLRKYNKLLKERDSLKTENNNLRRIIAEQNERICNLETVYVNNCKARRRKMSAYIAENQLMDKMIFVKFGGEKI